MLLVKTKTGPSTIPGAGTGLFADEFIAKGSTIWKFDRSADKAYTSAEAEALPEPQRTTILGLHHAYISKQTGRYIDPGDDAKFMNHAEAPNVGSRYQEGTEEDLGFALRDIQAGEELTIDYKTFAQEGVDF